MAHLRKPVRAASGWIALIAIIGGCGAHGGELSEAQNTVAAAAHVIGVNERWAFIPLQARPRSASVFWTLDSGGVICHRFSHGRPAESLHLPP